MRFKIIKMDEENKKLLKKNLKLNQEMHQMLKSIKKFILVQKIAFALKLLIIAIPIALGLIYLPPLFREYVPQVNKTIDQYQSLFNFSSEPGTNNSQSQISPEQLQNLSPEQLQKIKKILGN